VLKVKWKVYACHKGIHSSGIIELMGQPPSPCPPGKMAVKKKKFIDHKAKKSIYGCGRLPER